MLPLKRVKIPRELPLGIYISKNIIANNEKESYYITWKKIENYEGRK